MPKIFKLKEKLIVYLPFDMIKELGLKEGDEVEFFKYADGQFLAAKKSDLLKLITHRQPQQPQPPAAQPAGPEINAEELAVLKSLDSIRYGDRTKARLLKDLTSAEKKTLSGLIKRKLVAPFKKAGESEAKYGISKSIYNKYLMGTRTKQQIKPTHAAVSMQASQQIREQPKKWEQKLTESPSYLTLLESNGFLVVANQAEASAISTALEASIRSGQVVGTRAFNKKYYITLRSFVSRNAAKVMKEIGAKGTPVAEIAKTTGIDEEGIRSILYMLAENGEVVESKRDVFKVV